MASTKSILIYSTAYLPLVGGAEIAVKEITDRLPDFQFFLITARLKRAFPAKEKIGNVIIYRLGLGFWFDKFWLAFVGGRFGYRLIKKESREFDIVWSLMASFASLAALRFKELNPGTRFFLTLQEGDDLVQVRRKMLPLWWRFSKVFSQADFVQVISNYLGRWAREMGATAPITVLPNGVDLAKFNFVGRQKNKVIITTSRLVKKNGIDTLIKALIFLPGNYRLKILGQGEEESNLRSLVKKFRLEDRVDFVGLVPNQEIPKYLAEAEIFVRVARSEGLGNSFLEAMAVGLPVIATPVGGIPDFLREGETGWLVEPDVPLALAERIKLLTAKDNYPQIEQVIKQARRLVEQNYDWDKIAKEFGLLLTKLSNNEE